ncbi:MAG: class I SAM-dependent methyltransferase, partial [Candidatus Dormiibacterota bacterium]
MLPLSEEPGTGAASTPVRGLPGPTLDGCRILSKGSPTYRDGSEARLFEIVSGALDLSSGSDELADQSSNWPEQYHLTPARANFLRAMKLDAEMAVLDIGAGCGALSRYLGENCRLVDAIEPVLERARVARARTRDLPNVEVFVGSLADIPAETTYDLIVVAGVLEYVGLGAPDASPYRSLLAACASRLSPGGTLLVAIENSLGVKYLVGAPEDHSGRPFDSLEGYPEGSPARTFPRSTLTRWLIEVGLRPTFLSAFPDYKLTRTLLADRLFETQPDLAWRLAKFPSPDWPGPTRRVAREAAAWRTLVEAGLGSQTANSFVILASD